MTLAVARSEPERSAGDPHRLGSARALFLRLACAEPAPLHALVAGGVDWADLRALARREGVTAAVWPRLRRLLGEVAGASLPEEVEEAFRREAMVAEFHARRLEGRLSEVLALLGRRGIEPVLLKGAGLAYAVFGGMARRPMRDLDLLVPRSALAEAQAMLERAGWQEEGRPAGHPSGYRGHHHAPPLREPGGGPAVVELHSALFPEGHPFVFGAQRVLTGVRRIASPIGAVLVPAAEDQLLHAGLHFAWSHELRWGAWRSFADLDALLADAARQDAAPVPPGQAPVARAFDGVPEAARAARGGTSVYWALRLASRVGGVAVPEEWLERLAPTLPRWVEPRLERYLAHQLLPGAGNVPSVAVARWLWSAAVRPGWSGHGDARPWRSGAPGGRAAGGGASLAALGAQLRRLERWRRWAAAVAAR